MINRPYDSYKDYIKETFPSGEIVNTKKIESNLEWWFKNNIKFSFNYSLRNNNGIKEEVYNIGFDIYISNILSI